MLYKSDRTIYQVLEQHLKASSEPLTCVELMERSDVRKAAIEEFGDDLQLATNKLSDVLGFMWRKKLLTRYPYTRPNSKARFAYTWTERPSSPLPSPAKPKMKIVEHHDGVTIELASITIKITTR